LFIATISKHFLKAIQRQNAETKYKNTISYTIGSVIYNGWIVNKTYANILTTGGGVYGCKYVSGGNGAFFASDGQRQAICKMG
jgi:hypothetical protein